MTNLLTEHLGAKLDLANARISELEAEADRLSAHATSIRSQRDAANALLDAIRGEIHTCQHEIDVRDYEDKVHIEADGYRHISAYLADQPAALRRTEAENLDRACRSLRPAPKKGDVVNLTEALHYVTEPAHIPCPCPDVATCCVSGCMLKTRTEAEQEVLDASAAMLLKQTVSSRPPFSVKYSCFGGGQRCVDAEIARRGLK